MSVVTSRLVDDGFCSQRRALMARSVFTVEKGVAECYVIVVVPNSDEMVASN